MQSTLQTKELFVAPALPQSRRQQRLAQRPLDEIPKHTIPKRLRASLLNFDQDGNATSLQGERYEFWVYRQLRKRLDVESIRFRGVRFGWETRSGNLPCMA